MKKNIGLVITGIVLIAAAYYVFGSITDLKTESVKDILSANDLVESDEHGEKMMKDGEVMEKMEKEDAMEKDGGDSMEKMKKDGEVMMKKEDGEVMEKGLSEEISLKSVDPRGGDAQAARTYKDGVFTHYVTVNNIDPAEGKFFEGWITTSSGFISTGKMEKDEAGMWRLKYTANEDKTMYNRVVVTEETSADGLDNKPETHIFEGSF